MKQTLLELVQNVLSSIDGDEVDSIGDTIESRQVSMLVRRKYDQIMSVADLPEDFRLFQFEPVGPSAPVCMTKPENIDEVLWFKYNKISSFDPVNIITDVKYLQPKDFYEYMVGLNTSGDTPLGSCTVTTDQGDPLVIYFQTDRAPKYWTSFDDHTLVCDSYDSSIEANLQRSKSTGYGRLILAFEFKDSFVPPIDDNMFPLLLNESIALAWAELKQAQNAKVEKDARLGWVTSARRKQDLPSKTTMFYKTPDYGRK